MLINQNSFLYAIEILTKIRSNKYEMILVSNKPEYYVKKLFISICFFSAVSGGDTFKSETRSKASIRDN